MQCSSQKLLIVPYRVDSMKGCYRGGMGREAEKTAEVLGKYQTSSSLKVL